MSIDPANRVNQDALRNMISYAAADLKAADSCVDGLNNAIATNTYNERLYFQMMLASRLALYNEFDFSPARGILVTKASEIGGSVVIGVKFPYAFPYSKLDDITDWTIDGGVPGPYRYVDVVNSIWGPRTYSNSYDGTVSRTWRNLVYAGNYATQIRIGVQAHNNFPSTVWNASIGLRDGSSLDIVDGTFQYFTWDDEDRIELKPGDGPIYSDWLDYEVSVAPTCFFISMYCENSYSGFTHTGGTGCWYIDGDISKQQNWDDFSSAVNGNVNTHPRCLIEVQGQDLSAYSTWDGDQRIEKWLDSYNNLKPLIWSKPFGTKEVVRITSRATPAVGSRKTMIEDRNSILNNFLR